MFVVSLIVLASCDNYIDTPEVPTDYIKMGFIVSGDNGNRHYADTFASKGGEITNVNISTMGVYAYYTQGMYDNATSVPNFMLNTQVEKVAGRWRYSPLRYWPNSGYVSFFAYSPYTGSGDPYLQQTSLVTTSGEPKLTYTVPDGVIQQRDLLVSVPMLNKTGDDVNVDNRLEVNLQHALANIVFYAKPTAVCNFPVKVSVVRIGKFKNKALYSYINSANHWILLSDAQDKTYILARDHGGMTGILEDLDVSAQTEYVKISADNSNLMLLPQTVDAEDKIHIDVDLFINGITQAPITRSTETTLNTFMPVLEKGKRYSIKILISALADVTLTCVVSPWTDETINVPDFN